MFKPHRIEQIPQIPGAEAEQVFETTDFYLACYCAATASGWRGLVGKARAR